MPVCRKCKHIFEKGKTCPFCGSEDITNTFQGVIFIFDEEGEIAKNLNLLKGKYAIKV